ncbi:MAG: type II toxin-antitoxin system VapC family toxin [Methylobacter sp.]|nr:type II toxin-antitoxin system VapC family toxin [Methylobacter sp.]
MQKFYYLDANAIIKYSFFQEYLDLHSQQEDGVETVRSLIKSQAGIFYCSNFALLECWHTLLKKYRHTEDCKIFGKTSADQRRSIELIFKKLRKAVKDSELHIDTTPLTAHILVTAQKLTYKYGIQKQTIDSLDAIHLALVLELSARNQQSITLITSDNRMIEICGNESIEVFNPAK